MSNIHCNKKCCNDSKIIKILCGKCWEYRTLDGSENNLNNPEYGQAGTELGRLTKARYKDGISKPIDEPQRPNARDISNKVIHEDNTIFESGISAFFWLWGQFIDHDIVLTSEGEENHNIRVPKGDYYFDPKGTGKQVIPFKRTQAAGDNDQEVRQHINNLSSYIDASNVYGNSEERNKYLRLYKYGLLKTSNGYLPPVNDTYQDNAGGPGQNLFVCGDVRSNEHLGLTALHTLFVREHNYWAHVIYKCDPCLCDEEIYQRAKIMVEAEIQCITYNEWLPILLNKGTVHNFPKNYKESINPKISQEFATAAFRLGHSMVSTEVLRMDECGNPIYEGDLELKGAFFSPYRICNEGGIEPLLRGYAATHSERLEHKIINDLRNFLFGPPGHGGLDLGALNIQRGRDHGIPDYNSVRHHLGLGKVSSVHEISSNSHTVKALKDGYPEGPDTCDLWVAGLAEDRVKGALVGETFYYIIKDQFQRIKEGDRFWYQRRLPKPLRRLVECTKLSDIILRNTSIKNIQKNVFKQADRYCCKSKY